MKTLLTAHALPAPDHSGVYAFVALDSNETALPLERELGASALLNIGSAGAKKGGVLERLLNSTDKARKLRGLQKRYPAIHGLIVQADCGHRQDPERDVALDEKVLRTVCAVAHAQLPPMDGAQRSGTRLRLKCPDSRKVHASFERAIGVVEQFGDPEAGGRVRAVLGEWDKFRELARAHPGNGDGVALADVVLVLEDGKGPGRLVKAVVPCFEIFSSGKRFGWAWVRDTRGWKRCSPDEAADFFDYVGF